MSYIPELIATFEDENYYKIPYDNITGYAISRSGKVISNKLGEWKQNKVTYDKKTKYSLITLTTDLNNSQFRSRLKRQATYTMHKLLYSTFVSGRQHAFDETVDHKDSDRTNNDINNLQLLTRKQNTQKGQNRIGRITIDDLTVISISNDYKAGLKPKELREKYNISSHTIDRIIYGYCHSSITGITKKLCYIKKAENKAKITRIHQIAAIFENQFNRAIKKAKCKEQKIAQKKLDKEINAAQVKAIKMNIAIDKKRKKEEQIIPKKFLSSNPDYLQFTIACSEYAKLHNFCISQAKWTLLDKISKEEIKHVKIGKRLFIKKQDISEAA